MKRILTCLLLSGGCLAAAAQGQRETTLPSAQSQQREWSLYATKYADAERALACAGFPDLKPTMSGGGSQPIRYTPHPAVKHAAEVDAPVRGRGAALCSYIEVPQNRKWYEDNFRIRATARSR